MTVYMKSTDHLMNLLDARGHLNLLGRSCSK